MKVQVNREQVAAFLTSVKGITGQKSSNAFIRYVQMRVENGQLTLAVTDLESWVRQSLGIPGEHKDGSCCVDAELFGNIANLCPADELTLTLRDTQLHVVGGSDRYNLLTMDALEFPAWPDDESGINMQMSGADLRNAFKKVYAMAAKEKGRYALNGILIEPLENRVKIVATDGRRLARVAHVAKCEPVPWQVILPMSSCNIVNKIVQDGDVYISFHHSSVIFKSGGLELRTRMVEGQYPDYSMVLPSGLDKTCKIEANELRGGMSRAKLLTSIESCAVRMEFSPGEINLTSKSPSAGDSEITCVANYDGPNTVISLDPAYVLDVLNAMDASAVEVHFVDKDTGVVIHGGHEDLEYYLVMPIDL